MLAYVNGSSLSQQFVTAGTLGGTIANTINMSVAYRSTGPAGYLTGGMADVRIFNYALSAAQVAAIYNAGVK